MDCNCKNDILEKLKDIPLEWAEKIAEVICNSIIDEDLGLTCEQIRTCETVTELSEWTIAGMSVCIIYKDENGVSNKRCFNMADSLNLDTLDPKCIVSPSEWVTLGTVGQWQAFIDSLCSICQTTTTTTTSTTTTTTIIPIVTFDVCPGDDAEQACQTGDCEEPVTIYSPDMIVGVGSILYTDNTFTTPLTGVYAISAAGYYYELDITTGEITAIGSCSEFTSTTTTTTQVATTTSTTTTTTLPPLIGAVDLDVCAGTMEVADITFNGVTLEYHGVGDYPVLADENHQLRNPDRTRGTLEVTLTNPIDGARVMVYRNYNGHPATTQCITASSGQTVYTFNDFDMADEDAAADDPFYIWIDCMPCSTTTTTTLP